MCRDTTIRRRYASVSADENVAILPARDEKVHDCGRVIPLGLRGKTTSQPSRVHKGTENLA